MKILLGTIRVLLVVSVGIVLLFSVPHFFGIEVFYVSSGSMAPTLQVGDAIFVKNCTLDEINEQDIVTYSFSQSDLKISHRVLKVDLEQRIMLTKGDANDRTDGEWISGDCLIGKVVFHMYGFGNLAYLLSLWLGKLLAAGMLLWLFAFQGILEQWVQPQGNRNTTRRKRTGYDRKK